MAVPVCRLVTSCAPCHTFFAFIRAADSRRRLTLACLQHRLTSLQPQEHTRTLHTYRQALDTADTMELHFNMIGVASCYTHATSAFMILVLLSAGLIWRVIRVRRLRYQRIKECLKRYAYLEDKPALMTCELMRLAAS